jgi:hypothetical protein
MTTTRNLTSTTLADGVIERALEHIARMAHDANRAYCATIGDHSQPIWDHAPPWEQESARAGVRALIADPSLDSEQLHERWMVDKVNDGWTVGPAKDAILKTHPCLVPYDVLPYEQRIKDVLFGTIVRLFLKEWRL